MQKCEKSRSHCSAAPRRSPTKVQYALDLEAAMSALEAKLNAERICENAVSHVVQIVREFYDADCVLVLWVTPKFCVKSNECRNRAKFICGRQRLDRLPPISTT